MVNVKLISYSSSELSFVNNMQRTSIFELANKCSYKLGFSANKNACRGEMSVELYNKAAPDEFNIKIKLMGNFIFDDADAPRDEIHKTSYKLLFPHAKAAVTALTVVANVPPIFLPDINVDGQSVYIVENPKK